MRENVRDTILELALHEPQVSQYVKLYQDGIYSWTDMLERLVLALVENKQVLNKELTRAYERIAKGPTYNVAGNIDILGEV